MVNQGTTPMVQGVTPPRRLGRSVWAVVAGFLVVVVLSLGTDAVMHLLHIYPPLGQGMSDGLFALATIYRTIYAILGSYVTARLAPSRPMGHAMIGAAVGTIVGTVGAVVTWNKTDLGPHWYPLALIATGFPCAWIGGKIRKMQVQSK
jgi:Na+/citrate or Na+/malate symporter